MNSQDFPSSFNGTERLIGALQICFSDLLKTQKEQSDKLHKAVEALQQKSPVAEKKTTFWKHYQTLADEHDKELFQKISTDLDASLIFAGLFSAVSSAFIIQILPQIHPEGTLALVLVAQCLLVFSLFSTLLAALLAVLGKQWLMYYSAAGERGTIESRGLERQRKFEGLQRWKFNAVMHLFSLLLQLALLLFSAGLCVYLWTVHLSLAIIVLISTSGGFTAYVFFLMTSLVSPDSPFQNPMTPFVKVFIPLHFLRRAKEYFVRTTIGSRRLIECGWALLHPYVEKTSYILPHSLARKRRPPPQDISPLFPGAFPSPSPETPAVAWVLETSTDPLVVASAAEVAVDLRWPVNTDLAAPLARLRDSFLGCFVFADRYENYPHGERGTAPLKSVRAGMEARAITYGRAYCVLRLAHKSSGVNDDWVFEVIRHLREEESPALLNVAWILQGTLHMGVGSGAGAAGAVRWALRVIPSLRYKSAFNLDQFLQEFRPAGPAVPHLDSASFADYLFCLNSLFGRMNSQDMSLIDKSPIKDLLMCQLCRTLSTRLIGGKLEMSMLTRILETTARLASQFENIEWYSGRKSTKERKTAIYTLCDIIHNRAPGSVAAIAAAAQLASVDTSYPHIFFTRDGVLDLRAAEWVHITLEAVRHRDRKWNEATLTVVESLLQALLYYPGDQTQNFPITSFRTILRALSIPGPVSRTTFLLLSRSNAWFADVRLWPVIQPSSLWFDLGRITVESPESFSAGYIFLGHTLAQMPAWVPTIHRDLPGWLNVWLHRPTEDPELLNKIRSVLASCWAPENTTHPFTNERHRTLGLALTALTNVWGAFDFGTGLEQFFPLVRCTHDAVRETGDDTVFEVCKSNYLAPLGAALLRSAKSAQAIVESNDVVGINETLVHGASGLLEHLAHTILMGSHDERVDFSAQFLDKFDGLQRSLVGGQPACVVEGPVPSSSSIQ